MSTALTDNPKVQELTEKFDLEIPSPSYRGVVTEWEMLDSGCHPDVLVDHIVIHSIDIYDTEDKFIKKADLSVLKDNMHLFSFTFKKK